MIGQGQAEPGRKSRVAIGSVNGGNMGKKREKGEEVPAVPQGLPAEIWVWRYPPDESSRGAQPTKSTGVSGRR